jgi:hypothetical protein
VAGTDVLGVFGALDLDGAGGADLLGGLHLVLSGGAGAVSKKQVAFSDAGRVVKPVEVHADSLFALGT